MGKTYYREFQVNINTKGFTFKSNLEEHDETSFDSMQEVRSDMMCI